MFGIGGTELICILVVALVVLGPEHLPKVMRSLGKTVGTLRRVSTEFQRTINTDLALDELDKPLPRTPAVSEQERGVNPFASGQTAESAPDPGKGKERRSRRPVASPRLRRVAVQDMDIPHANPVEHAADRFAVEPAAGEMQPLKRDLTTPTAKGRPRRPAGRTLRGRS